MKHIQTIINLTEDEWETAVGWATDCKFDTPDDLIEHIVKDALGNYGKPDDTDFVTRIRGETANSPVDLDHASLSCDALPVRMVPGDR